jgi:SpoVK/Ycf46/Vps4 family AAA+-type ATPase
MASAQGLARQKAEEALLRTGQARDALALAQQEATRKLLNEQLQTTTASAQQQAQALERALQEEAKLAELRRAAAEVMIQEKAVRELDRLDRAVREAEIKRQAVATRLRFALDTGKFLDVVSASGTQQISGQTELLVDADVSLLLPGLGSLTITPGGEDLVGLAREHEDALQVFRQQLLLLGVTDLAQAQNRLQSCKSLAGQIQLAEQALLIVAPKGVADLRAQQELATVQIQQIQQAMDRLPAASLQPVMALDEAQRELDSALALETLAQKALNTADLDCAKALSRRDQATQERDAALAVMADPQRMTKLAQAQEDWLANQASLLALSTRVANQQAQWEAANPGFIDQDIQRFRQSLESMRQAQVKRREDMLVLQNTLELAGAQGLDEQRQQLQSKLTFERKRHEELQRRAQAISLLCDKLESKRQATLQRLQTPLLQRMRHYLQLLFPGSTMEVDDNLAPQKLLRNRTTGTEQIDTVEALSFGSREQLGLISRFAYADLLAQANRPTLLILDDALVHSDEERLSQMKRILFDVAQRHQVLLFSCHPNAWRDIGAPMKTL